MIRPALVVSTVAAVVTGACASSASEKEKPAVLSISSPDIRAEITDVISKALHGSNVQIADNSLMETNRLIIERRNAVHKGITIMIRDDPMPDHFRLMMSGKSCVLVHEQTGEAYPLNMAVCKAMPEKS